MEEQISKRELGSQAADEPGSQLLSRRAMLKGGVRAMPVVLTLQSGAALARSSNLISAAAPHTRDSRGNTLCLDTGSVRHLRGGKYDFGQPADGVVNVIANRDFYLTANRRDSTTTEDMCYDGGPYYFHEMGWHEVRLPTNGVVVSSTALISVSARGDIDFNRIG